MRTLTLLLLLFAVISCKKDQSTLSETADYFLVPRPYVNQGNKQATIVLYEPLEGDFIRAPEKADFIEIYYSNDSTSLKFFKKISATQTEINIPNLVNGVPYYFLTKTFKGKKSVSSDTVMTIPGIRPEIRLFPDASTFNSSVHGNLLSSDGKLMYYQKRNDTTLLDESYIKTLATNTVAKMVRPSVGLAWANHSHKLLQLHNSYTIVLYDADKNSESDVMTIPSQYENSGFTFSPDDQSLYYSTTLGVSNGLGAEIWKMALDTKVKTQISNLSSNHLSIQGKLAVSPDEKSIYFAASMAFSTNLWTPKAIYNYTLASKTLKAKLPEKWHDGSPSLSPDGKYLAFTSYRTGFQELWLLNTSSNELRQLTNMSDYRFSTYSNFSWLSSNEIVVAMHEANSSDYGNQFYKLRL